MAAPNGLKCIEEFPDMYTLIYPHVADLDVVSTYPNVSQLLNIARETCLMEFSMIKGIPEKTKREIGVNLTAGPVNAIEICEKILGSPSLDQMLELFNVSKRQKFTWSRYGDGYEVSTKGDSRFSALVAKLDDGRTIECHYQCDVKRYNVGGTNWRDYKGKPPCDPTVDLYREYKKLWYRWAELNPDLLEELRINAKNKGYLLTDMFASTEVSQARALAEILNETET